MELNPEYEAWRERWTTKWNKKGPEYGVCTSEGLKPCKTRGERVEGEEKISFKTWAIQEAEAFDDMRQAEKEQPKLATTEDINVLKKEITELKCMIVKFFEFINQHLNKPK